MILIDVVIVGVLAYIIRIWEKDLLKNPEIFVRKIERMVKK